MNKSQGTAIGLDLLERVYGNWWIMLLEGLFLLTLGLIMTFNSTLALTLVIFIFGVYRGIMGMIYIISALIARSKYGSNIGFGFGRGIVDLIICAVFLLAQKMIVTFFIVIIGIWAIGTGIFLLIASGNLTGIGKVIKIIVGIVLIGFGIYAFFDPLGQAGIFTMLLGVILGLLGLFLLIQSIKMKKNFNSVKKENKGYDDYEVE